MDPAILGKRQGDLKIRQDIALLSTSKRAAYMKNLRNVKAERKKGNHVASSQPDSQQRGISEESKGPDVHPRASASQSQRLSSQAIDQALGSQPFAGVPLTNPPLGGQPA